MHDWTLVAVYGGAALVASLASALASAGLVYRRLRTWRLPKRPKRRSS